MNLRMDINRATLEAWPNNNAKGVKTHEQESYELEERTGGRWTPTRLGEAEHKRKKKREKRRMDIVNNNGARLANRN